MYQTFLEFWILCNDYCLTFKTWLVTTQHIEVLYDTTFNLFPFLTQLIEKLKAFCKQFKDRFCILNGGLPRVKQVLATYDVVIYLQKKLDLLKRDIMDLIQNITFLWQYFIFLWRNKTLKLHKKIRKEIYWVKRAFLVWWTVSFPFFFKIENEFWKKVNKHEPTYPKITVENEVNKNFFTFFELNDYNPLYLEQLLPKINPKESIFEASNLSGLEKLIQFTNPIFVYFKNYSYTGNPLYLLKYSPWPYLVSIFTLHFVLVFINFLDSVKFDYSYLFYSFLLFFTSVLRWLFDLSIESLKGVHNSKMRSSFVIGFLLFILSEVMFFFSLFWAFFNFSLSTNIWLLYWPPQGLLTNVILNSNYIPELNTFLLIFSGFLLTVSHELFVSDRTNRNISLFFLSLTILFGFLFLVVQYFEFKSAFFNFNDSVYASTIFFLTGFHGFHVLLGVIALFIALYRNLMHYTTITEHQGFEFAIWYWHFVDVIWFFVYYFIYIWGNTYY